MMFVVFFLLGDLHMSGYRKTNLGYEKYLLIFDTMTITLQQKNQHGRMRTEIGKTMREITLRQLEFLFFHATMNTEI